MGRAEIFIAGGTRKGSFFSVRNGNFERHAYTHGCSFGRAGVDNGYLGTRIDGGVQNETAPRLVQAGADVLVSGSYIFGAENPTEVIKSLKNTAL